MKMHYFFSATGYYFCRCVMAVAAANLAAGLKKALSVQEKTMAKERGRPKGSGIDDTSHLTAVAEEISANPAMSARKAIKAVLARAYPSDDHLAPLNVSRASVVHRLAAKWRQEGAVYLAAAHERKQLEAAERAAETIKKFLAGAVELDRALRQTAEQAMPWISAAASKFETYLNSPEGRRVLEFTRTVQKLQRDPAMAKRLLGSFGKGTPLLSAPKALGGSVG